MLTILPLQTEATSANRLVAMLLAMVDVRRHQRHMSGTAAGAPPHGIAYHALCAEKYTAAYAHMQLYCKQLM